jgi:heavy metal sensor kinase
MNTRSIRFQLLAWYAVLLFCAFAVFGLFMYAALGGLLRQNLRDTLAHRARQVARTMGANSNLMSPDSLREEISLHYAPESSGRFVRITSQRTNVLYLSGLPQDRSFDPQDVQLPPETVNEKKFRVERLPRYSDLLLAELPVAVGTNRFAVEVGTSLAPVSAALRNLLVCLLIGVPILIAVTGAGAYMLVGRALRPVIEIAQSAEHISLHNLNERLPMTHTGDELETLSTALNRMISRICEAYENTRRFVADASHELRTPLAVLRGEIENVVTRNHLTAETRETLGSNLEEVERLGKIVEGLFALSRLDAGEAHSETVRFDLAALAATTTEQMCLLAEDKDISLRCEASAPVFVEGDRARLKQVIVNLVDNAIKYTWPGGSVRVRTYKQEFEAILEVTDNGIGIPKNAVPYIFDRFYRVDKSRSSDQGSAGLGLSIVRSICHAHSGKVEVDSRERAGSAFRVHLPLLREEETAQTHDSRPR